MKSEYYASNYDDFAWLYNKNWADFTDRLLPVLEKYLFPLLSDQSKVLDLCCGTGQLAKELSNKGYEIFGIDLSEKMIEIAKKNAPDAIFYTSDAREFSLPLSVDAVISAYDSLNHLMSLNEMKQVFTNVFDVLKEKGVFLFDLNLEQAHKERWNGSMSFVEDQFVCVVQASYDSDQRMAENKITIFEEKDNLWSRSDVTLHQRNYPTEDILHLLKEAGFKKARTLDVQHLGFPNSKGREFYLAEK